MIIFRLIKLFFLLVYNIFIWTISIVIFTFVVVSLAAFLLPEEETFLVDYQKNTNPFNDSIFHQFEEHLATSENKDISAENRLKIIQNCINEVPVSKYTRYWSDFNQNRYKSNFEISNSFVCEASYNRNQIYVNLSDRDGYWRSVYSQIVQFDTTKMGFIYDYFEELRVNKELDYVDFANAVVSFVQSIPYTLILSTTKDLALQEYNSNIREYLLQNKGPYIENIKFGLLSPLEFFHTIRGDCDTRTLVVYSILSHFGYDVVVLNCTTHSMIGLNLPAQGKAIKVKGKKYYFWETTAEGWQLGQLPPEYNSEKDWYVALSSVNDF